MEELRDATLQVHTAEERKEDRELVASTHRAVQRLTDRYRDFCASLSDPERMRVERTLGRRMTDLRRLASLLPRIGDLAGSTPDRQVQGASIAGERKITGVSWGAGQRLVDAKRTVLRVGGDVEAWCGPCGGMTEHHIIAMVGDQPRQVVCQACGGRHNYRTTPARKSAAETEASSSASTAAVTPEAVKRAEKKADELRALAAEVNSAEQVRSFDPKERFRVGEVVMHSEWGRGKVETVLRSSILVRFARGGLKSLMLY